MTTTSTAVDHGITIEQSQQSYGTTFRASCLCGYASALIGERERAQAAGRWHVEQRDAPRHYVDTADLGVIPFPAHCPAWCDREGHLAYAAMSEGCNEAVRVTAHHADGGDCSLDEIRNRVRGEIERDGGGRWNLTARQALLTPGVDHSGYAGPPLIELFVADHGLGGRYQAAINLTTGEARVLIAHLTALCDRVDLGEVRR